MEVYVFKKFISTIIVSGSLFLKKRESTNSVQHFKENIDRRLLLLIPKIKKRKEKKFYPLTIF